MGNVADIQIRFASLEHIPLDDERPWQHHILSRNQVLLNVKEVAKFLVSDGQEILVDPYPQAEESALRLYLLGSSMGCILHQRKLLPLHANALQFGDECVAFMGQSGAGKSTLAAAMKNRGYKVLADDVCAVNIAAGSKPHIYPGVPQIKLWKDAADYLAEDVSRMRRIQRDEEKFALPIDDGYCRQTCPIKSIYILDYHDEKELKIEEMSALEKIGAIKNNTYRKGMVAKLGNVESHLQMSGALADAARMRRVVRPRNSLSRINELMDAIEDDLR